MLESPGALLLELKFGEEIGRHPDCPRLSCCLPQRGGGGHVIQKALDHGLFGACGYEVSLHKAKT